jgi:hypothetical protein
MSTITHTKIPRVTTGDFVMGLQTLLGSFDLFEIGNTKDNVA